MGLCWGTGGKTEGKGGRGKWREGKGRRGDGEGEKGGGEGKWKGHSNPLKKSGYGPAPNPARDLGERCKLPQRGPKSNLVHFSLKIRHLVAKFLMILLRVLSKKISVAPLLGGPRSSGARFIEPPEPPVPTPLIISVKIYALA